MARYHSRVSKVWFYCCISPIFLLFPQYTACATSTSKIISTQPRLYNRTTRAFSLTMSNDISPEPRKPVYGRRKPIQLPPIQIGLTGSIGMGKSTVAQHFRDIGFPVFDADACVHHLYSRQGKAVEPIKNICPDVVVEGAINRELLSKKVLNKEISLDLIEKIVHPLVAAARKEFFQQKSSEGNFLVVFDIPLLFEKPSTSDDIDYVIVASATPELQRSRCLQRSGMTVEKFESILSKQLPDEEKRKRADFVVDTSYKGFSEAKAQVATVIEKLIAAQPSRWSAWKTRIGTPSLIKTRSHPSLNTMLDESIARESLSESWTAPSTPVLPSKSIDAMKVIKDNIKLVVFDLDDTLVEAYAPIKAANDMLMNWMAEHMPKTAADMKSKFRPTLIKIVNENPLLAHDLTRVRREAMIEIATVHGEEELVNESLEMFIKARSSVGRYLYEDVMPCIDWLNSLNIQVAVVTNGNANLSLCEILGPKLALSINAQNVGAAKPSPVPFIAISQLCKIPASQILFIGDSFEADVKGSINAGMLAGLLKRNTSIDAAHKFPTPEPHSIPSRAESSFVEGKYFELDSLHPDELESKLSLFLSSRCSP